MITIKVDDSQVKSMLASFPKQASRALEMAIDKTAFKVKERVVGEMKKVFDKPTPWTLNSLKVTKTKGHNMTAIIGFKEPDRKGVPLTEHYLVSEVVGGARRKKGLEIALGAKFGGDVGSLIPAPGSKRNAYGNVTGQSIQNIIASLKSEGGSNREFIYLPKGSGNRLPGIYQRIKDGKGFGRKTTKTLPFGSWQAGRKRGRFGSTANFAVADARAIVGRGLKAIMLKGRDVNYKARLPFYAIGQKVVDQEFPTLFSAEFAKIMGHP
jgi:hypothetical protein